MVRDPDIRDDSGMEFVLAALLVWVFASVPTSLAAGYVLARR